jgi:hypothetical protein
MQGSDFISTFLATPGCRGLFQSAFETHAAELQRKLLVEEANLQELQKENERLRRENAKSQRDFSSAVVSKVTGSAAFEATLLDLLKTSNDYQSHEDYKALRGWIPGPHRLECQKSMYKPGAADRYTYKLQQLKRAGLKALAPATWEALSGDRPLSVSELKKVPEKMSNRGIAPEEPGEDKRNAFGVCPESPVDDRNYVEYCANPNALGYTVIDNGEGPQIGLSDEKVLYQLREAIAPVTAPAQESPISPELQGAQEQEQEQEQQQEQEQDQTARDEV